MTADRRPKLQAENAAVRAKEWPLPAATVTILDYEPLLAT